MKRLRITIENKRYEVLVEVLDDLRENASSAPPMPVRATNPPSTAVSAPPPVQVTAAAISAPVVTDSAADVPSPLAGKIVSIDVAIGETVAHGAQVATIEAMKMNTYIYAPRAGKVSAILVKPGQGVDEGGALMKIT